MGYCIDVEIKKFIIKKDNVQKCLNAINELHSDETLLSNAESGMWPRDIHKSVREQYCYAWVHNPNGNGFKDIREAFEAWRYYFKDGKIAVQNGNVVYN